MKNYTDYDFYKNTYMGNMPETDFDKLVIRASLEVRNAILNKDITGHEEEVRMATCSVADILNEINKIKQKKQKLMSSEKADRIIASEQVADVSRSFANVNNIKDLDSEISNLENNIYIQIEKYLFYTGLLNRRAYGRFI